ncbi:MAG: stage II sporulation protein R [Clostridia bacterium]|nr:stage II sporulation protein R [Clostridia bacterium]
MKKTATIAAVLLAITLTIALMPTEAEAKIYEDTVRLHILANSDSDEDQSLKLAVRDEVLLTYGAELSDSHTKLEAEERIRRLTEDIKECAEGVISRHGYAYPVSVSLTSEWYDTREYESFTLPKGYYTSLKIVIGRGDGRNWWCVMYPPLCLDAATDAPSDDAVLGYTDEEVRLISGRGYKVKFKLLEVVSEIFARDESGY